MKISIKNRKIVFTILMLVSFLINLEAQSDTDSLERVLKTKIPDSTRVSILLELSSAYKFKNNDKSLFYFEQLLTLSKKKNDKKNLIESYLGIGWIYDLKGVRLDSIISIYQKGLAIAETEEDTDYQIMLLTNIAGTYERVGQTEKALSVFLQTLKIAEKADNERAILVLLINISILYANNGELELAKEKCLKAIQYAEKINHQVYLGQSMATLATIYIDLNDNEAALETSYKALEIQRKANEEYRIVITMANLSSLHIKKGEYEKAYKLANEAYELAKKVNYRLGIHQALLVLSLYHKKRGAYDKAIMYAKEGLEILGQNGEVIDQMKSYRLISSSYEKLGKYKEAFEAQKIYHTLSDSLFKTKKANEIDALSMKYEVDKKEIENKKLKSEQTKSQSIIRQRTILGIAAILILILVTIIAIILRRSNQLKKTQNERLEKEVQSRTKELLTANEALEESKNRRLLEEAKARFFANVSHELRTPLTLIQAPLETILNSGQLDNKNWTQLTRTLQNTEKLNNLVNQIMDLTKFEANKLKLHETPEVLYLLTRRTIAAFESYTQQKEIKLSLNYEVNTSLQIEIDKEKFERILTNYLSNAIKFTPKGGSITVTIKELNNKLQLSVMDTGIGIHHTEIEQVFERYYQANYAANAPLGQMNPYSGGAGIGLSLCRDYAQMFGGRVWAESPVEDEKGSIFYFEFPKKEIFGALTTEAKLEIDAPKELKKSTQKKEVITSIIEKEDTILVVEDNFDLRSFLVELLSEKYEVIAAEHGQEALDILHHIKSNNSKLPSLIVSDVMMPIVDGFELLNQLKSSNNYRHIPVVMLTARAELKDKLKALRIGVDDYILKPFGEVELKVRINNLINTYRGRVMIVNELQKENSSDEETVVLEVSEQDTAFLESLETFILRNVDNAKIISDDIATELLMSRAKLFRKVKGLTGLTLNQYVNEVRLQKAKTLLEMKRISSVKEVTYAVGFKQASYFSKIYEERFGKRPSEYF